MKDIFNWELLKNVKKGEMMKNNSHFPFFIEKNVVTLHKISKRGIL
jgi:hypothetical protein